MSQHNEIDFVIPVLKTIQVCPVDCTTAYIKRNVHFFIDLTEQDLLPYPSRNTKEPRYYQVVGNLISHRNTTLFRYIEQVPVIGKDGKPTAQKKFLLNQAGVEYLQTLSPTQQPSPDTAETRDILDEYCTTLEVPNAAEAENTPAKETDQEELPTVPEDDFTITDPFDAKIIDYALHHGLDKRPPTESKIAITVIELSGYKCEYAASIGKKHSLFVGKSQHPFMEGHHLVPMKAAKDFFPLNLDRPSNIVSLCPGCHALLHHATRAEKEKVLRVIYDNHIDQLNADGIYISFEKLLTKYY